MPSTPSTPNPGDLFASLVRVVHLIGLAGAQELSRDELTPAQFQLLVLIDRNPRVVQRELTEVLGVTKGNVSQLLTRLQDAGLVVRTTEGAANRIALTPTGEALVRRLMPAHRRFLERSFAAVSADELAVLSGLISRIEAAL